MDGYKDIIIVRFDLEAFGEVNTVARISAAGDSVGLTGLLFFAGKKDKNKAERKVLENPCVFKVNIIDYFVPINLHVFCS
jgi:hypothetical protein